MKFSKKFLALIFLTVLGYSNIAATEAPEVQVKATINTLENALNDNNIVELESIYSDEATVIPSETEVITDKSAIASFWNGQLSKGKSLYNINIIDLQVTNNIAYLSASWSATVIKDGDYEILDGYVSNVLEKQSDGNWKIRVQNWN